MFCEQIQGDKKSVTFSNGGLRTATKITLSVKLEFLFHPAHEPLSRELFLPNPASRLGELSLCPLPSLPSLPPWLGSLSSHEPR